MADLNWIHFRFQGTYLALRNVSAAKLNGRLNCDVTNPVGSVRSNDIELRIHCEYEADIDPATVR